MQLTRRRFLTLATGATIGALTGPAWLRGSLKPAQAQPIPGAPSFRGAAGTSILGPVTLNAGLAVFRAQHNGSGNFAVTLLLPNPAETVQQSVADASYTDSSLVYDEVGPVNAGAVAQVGSPGDHYLNFTASGAFQVTIEQPLPENVSTVQQTVFQGKGKGVTPYFMLPPGLSSLSVSTTSASLRAWLYHIDDLGGEPVLGGIAGYDGRFFDFTFPGNQNSYPVNLPDSGPYLLATDNLSRDEAWTYTFQ